VLLCEKLFDKEFANYMYIVTKEKRMRCEICHSFFQNNLTEYFLLPYAKRADRKRDLLFSHARDMGNLSMREKLFNNKGFITTLIE